MEQLSSVLIKQIVRGEERGEKHSIIIAMDATGADMTGTFNPRTGLNFSSNSLRYSLIVPNVYTSRGEISEIHLTKPLCSHLASLLFKKDAHIL